MCLYWKYMFVMILRVIDTQYYVEHGNKKIHLQDLILDELDNSDNIIDYINLWKVCTYNPVTWRDQS